MSEYYAVVRSTDHLAHYGVRGMKWGVRNALARGNEKALDRSFRRAAKKLKKLTDIGINSKKYAAKAVAYGVAAAGTGTMAIGGKKFTGDIVNSAKRAIGIKNKINSKTIGLGVSSGISAYAKTHRKLMGLKSMIPGSKASAITAISNNKPGQSGKKTGFGGSSSKKVNNAYKRLPISNNDKLNKVISTLKSDRAFRIGTGVAAAGLATLSGVNAYRASHGSKYRKKALTYKNAMDEVFSGTKYEGKYVAEPRRRKRRNRVMG